MKHSQTSTPIMSATRLEAFSDAVIAIIITIMVLELKPPREASVSGLIDIGPVFLSYVLSFVLVAIMWVNHHHLVHLARFVDGRLLWTNNHLLFWISLIPFSTAFLGRNPASPFAVALYSIVLGCAVVSFTLLRHMVSQQHVDDPGQMKHHAAVQRRNVIAALVYLLGAGLAYASLYVAYAILVAIPLFYFMPAQRPVKRR